MNAETTVVRPARPAGVLAPDAAGARLAGWLLSLPVRLLGSQLGRRTTAAAAVSLVLMGGVGALYQHADAPSAVPVPAKAAAAAPAAAGRGLTTPAPAVRRGPARAEDVAVAWFAKRQNVAVGQVRALQQRRVSADERRVLVIAEAGASRLPSAYVTVRRGPSGWAVS
jgi:hypothetical protein